MEHITKKVKGIIQNRITDDDDKKKLLVRLKQKKELVYLTEMIDKYQLGYGEITILKEYNKMIFNLKNNYSIPIQPIDPEIIRKMFGKSSPPQDDTPDPIEIDNERKIQAQILQREAFDRKNKVDDELKDYLGDLDFEEEPAELNNIEYIKKYLKL